MNPVNPHQAESNPAREATLREELIDRVQRGIREDGRVELYPGFFLARASVPDEPVYGVVEPSFCVIVQGSKEVSLGETRHHYDPYHYLLVCLEVPVVFRVLEASPEKPYLGLRLNITPEQVVSVLAEMEQLAPVRRQDAQAIRVIACQRRTHRLRELLAGIQRIRAFHCTAS